MRRNNCLTKRGLDQIYGFQQGVQRKGSRRPHQVLRTSDQARGLRWRKATWEGPVSAPFAAGRAEEGQDRQHGQAGTCFPDNCGHPACKQLREGKEQPRLVLLPRVQEAETQVKAPTRAAESQKPAQRASADTGSAHQDQTFAAATENLAKALPESTSVESTRDTLYPIL